MRPVFLQNTATRRKDKFEPSGAEVRLYCCGPTVYHYAHIGNLRTYVSEDLLVRTLKRAGHDVHHVMNITDVGHLVSDADEGEDRMEKGSRREGRSAWEIAEYYAQVFFADLEKLKCLKPTRTPKATDHIPEMIALVQDLEAKGLTYRTSDGIYYDTAKFPRYADFAKLKLESLEAGIRVALGEKKSATDFALWKFSPAGTQRQMEWDSPWGRGFPGWHIECSAMAMKYLGSTLDIHCGGKDHIPVHHTNEIAQSEASTGKQFSRYWLHPDFLIDETGKMSKRNEDFLTLSRVLEEGFRPADYRFLLLQAHYKTELRFDWKDLRAAQAGFDGILNRMADWGSETASFSPSMEKFRDRFDERLCDDLDSPGALNVLFEMLKEPSLTAPEKRALLLDFDEVLGLGFEEEFQARRGVSLDTRTEELLRQRDEARRSKNWAESDRLREELVALGYKVEDTPGGTRVSRG